MEKVKNKASYYYMIFLKRNKAVSQLDIFIACRRHYNASKHLVRSYASRRHDHQYYIIYKNLSLYHNDNNTAVL